MTVGTTFKQVSRADAQVEIELPGLGNLEAGYLDLDGRQYHGAIYRLNAQAKPAILEVLGFSARFDQASVRSAFLNIRSTEASIVLEVVKNAKPNEVAVRYSAERWQTERASTTSDGLRPWLKNTYRCHQLPEESAAIICDALAIPLSDLENFFIRLDLKEEKVGLVVEAKAQKLLPTGEISSFILPEAEPEETPPATPQTKIESVSQTTALAEKKETPAPEQSLKQQEANMNSTQPRYATYSQSEVDQLLKQQSEQLNATIQSKVAAQRKEIAESLKANEKQLKQIADEMKINGEELRKKLETSHNSKSSIFAENSSKAGAELTQQIEAFKNHLNKSVMPSLKNLDARILKIVQEAKPQQDEKQESKTPLILASLAVVISLVSLVLNFVKH